MANFATATDMTARYSPNLLGDLLGDGGERIPASAMASDSIMAAMLATATGRIKAAARAGQRYTEEQLSGLLDPSSAFYDAESAAYLTDLTCRVAFWLLFQRKPWADSHESARRQAEAEYNEAIEQFRTGTHILNIGSDDSVADNIGVNATNKQYIYSETPRGRFFPRRRLYG